jgi:hypothetical protein
MVAIETNPKLYCGGLHSAYEINHLKGDRKNIYNDLDLIQALEV